jgi:hypothetical protein
LLEGGSAMMLHQFAPKQERHRPIELSRLRELSWDVARIHKLNYADAERRVIMNLGGAEQAQADFEADWHVSRCKDPARCYLEWHNIQRQKRRRRDGFIILACIFVIVVVVTMKELS